MIHEFDVIVVGELNVDLLLNNIDTFPEMGKEKLAGSMDLVLGSSSAIFAGNLSSMGAGVAFLGMIGTDDFGQCVLDGLQQQQVDTSLIVQSPDVKTGATIILNYDNDRAMVTHQGAMAEFKKAHIAPDTIAKARHLHLSSYFLQPGLQPDVVAIFREAKEAGLTTSLDVQWDPEENWDIDLPVLLPYVDIFLPNETEALHLTGASDLSDALDQLAKLGNIVVVKMGQKGSMAKQGETVLTVEPFLNENVVDAIGAGDSFNAGFIKQFIAGQDLQSCLTNGNLMGAVSTTQPGGTAAFASYDEVRRVAQEQFGQQID